MSGGEYDDPRKMYLKLCFYDGNVVVGDATKEDGPR